TKLTHHLRKPGEGTVPGPGGARSEYQWDHHATDGDFYWYGIAIYLPDDWQLGSNEGWRIPLQFHLGSGQPGFNIEYGNGSWKAVRRVGTNTSKTTLATLNMLVEEWNTLVVKARW